MGRAKADFDINSFDWFRNVIAAQDINFLRDHLQKNFWAGFRDDVQWRHLEAALRTGDCEKIALIAAWATPPSALEMRQLEMESGAKYPDYLRLMRQAGVKYPAAAPADAAISPLTYAARTGNIETVKELLKLAMSITQPDKQQLKNVRKLMEKILDEDHGRNMASARKSLRPGPQP